MTLWTMEQLLNHMEEPKSLTDAWSFSEEVEGFDADTLLSTIMLKGMSFEPLFTDPRFYYMMNQQWWNKWKFTFDKWFTVINKEYEPLWDRNGYEEVHEDTVDTGTLDTTTSGREVVDDDTTGTKNSTTTTNEDIVVAESGTDDTTTDTTTTEDNTTNTTTNTEGKVSAYNSSTYQPDTSSSTTTNTTEDKDGTEHTVTDNDWTKNGRTDDDTTETYSETTSGTDDRTTTTSGTVDTDTTGDRDFDREYHSWGNWGISQTSQKLLLSELEVRYHNLYEHIADIFVDEMCIGVF